MEISIRKAQFANFSIGALGAHTRFKVNGKLSSEPNGKRRD